MLSAALVFGVASATYTPDGFKRSRQVIDVGMRLFSLDIKNTPRWHSLWKGKKEILAEKHPVEIGNHLMHCQSKTLLAAAQPKISACRVV